MFKKKPQELICKNCRLFNESHNQCQVTIIHEGQRLHIPVDKNDKCFFENKYIARDEVFQIGVNQVKIWVENDKGEKTSGNGKVKIEYPDNFFNVDNKNE